MKIQEYFHIRYNFSREDVLADIGERCPVRGNASYICVADGNVLTFVHKDLAYRRVIADSAYSICDSSWVPLYLKRIYGIRPPQYSGSEIFQDIVSSRRYRMYFLGSSREVLDALKSNLLAVDPAIGGMTFRELPFCGVDGFDYEGIAADINADAPDIVWISLGAPKQEIFASRLAPLLDGGVVIPVGAVFNFRAGLGIRRAPQWMVRCHLEFVHRIMTEPRKQLGRVWNIVSTLPAIYGEEKGRCRK